MTASRPSADLAIPDAALRPLLALYPDFDSDEDAQDEARRIAAPVVAQFLRDLASAHDRVSGGLLAELADGLDGGVES